MTCARADRANATSIAMGLMFEEGTSSVASRHLLQQEGWRRDKSKSLLHALRVEKVPEGRMRSLHAALV